MFASFRAWFNHALPIRVHLVASKAAAVVDTSDFIEDSQLILNAERNNPVHWARVPAESAQADITQPSLSNNDGLPTVNSDSTSALLAHDDRERGTQFRTLFDLILHYEELFTFACLTGLINLVPHASLKSSHPELYYKYRKYFHWTTLLYVSYIVYPIINMLSILLPAITIQDSFSAFTIVNMLRCIVQNLLLYPAIIYLRHAFFIPRYELNNELYVTCFMQSMQFALQIGKYFNILAIACSFLFSLFTPILFLPLYVFGCITFIISNYLFIGVFHFIYFELMISYCKMKQFRENCQNYTATREEYLQLYQEMNKRNAHLPINIFLMISIISTVFELVLIWSLTVYDLSPAFILIFIFAFSTLYGRESLFLLLILHKILLINSQSGQMIKNLSLQYWPTVPNEIDVTRPADSRDASMNQHVEHHRRDHQRTMIYILLRESPFGVKIFYFQLSRWQLLTQIVSIIITISLVILRAIIISNI